MLTREHKENIGRRGKLQFYKKIKHFEWFIEIEKRQILPTFFDYRFEDRTYEIWLGRCYFVLTIAET